jgi:hypothetical protein
MKTEIAFILDRSGSMSSMTQAAIDGFNEFLLGQQQTIAPDGKTLPADMSLILFDHEYLPVYKRVPIQEIAPLNRSTYEPRGNTALLDAIGRTIDELGASLAALPESQRPQKVIVAILTDGEENASKHESKNTIRKKITHQTTVYSWEFLFLAANQDAFQTASSMGIEYSKASNFMAEDGDLKSVQKSVSLKMSAMRKSAAGMKLERCEEAILGESMTETVERVREKK